MSRTHATLLLFSKFRTCVTLTGNVTPVRIGLYEYVFVKCRHGQDRRVAIDLEIPITKTPRCARCFKLHVLNDIKFDPYQLCTLPPTLLATTLATG